MSRIDDKELLELKDLLSMPKRVCILSHRNPDGDAVGSSLALKEFLQAHNHWVDVCLPSEYPEFFAWMPSVETIRIYDIEQAAVGEIIRKSEVVFCLDFNSLDRIDKMSPFINPDTQKVVMIDHHLDPYPFANISFSYPAYSSTCELLFDVVEGLNPGYYRGSQSFRDAIYTGIMTDTGSFHHSTSAELFDIMSQLKETGLDDRRLQELIANQLPDKYLKLLGHCLNNRMTLYPEWHFGMIYLNRADYAEFNIQRGDTEGIVNYLMMLKSVHISALVMEQPTIVKLSLRSKGDSDVQSLMSKHFNGGGHRNAAGGAMRASLDTVRQKLLYAVEEMMTH